MNDNVRKYLEEMAKTLDPNTKIYGAITDLVNNNYPNDKSMEVLKEIEALNECPPELKDMINNIEKENTLLAENNEELKEEPEAINDENLNNVQHLPNPSLEHLKTVYKNIRDSQNNDFKLNVEIKYEDDGNITVDMGYKDNDGKDYTIAEASYTTIDIDEFNKNELKFLLEDHTEKGSEIKETGEKRIVSENGNGETLSIEGNEQVTINTADFINNNNQQLEKQQVKSNNKVLVRKIGSMDNTAYSSSNIYIVLFTTLLIIIIITVLFILLK